MNAHKVDDGVSLLLNRAAQLPPVDHDQLVLFAARIYIGSGQPKRAEELTKQLEAAGDPAIAQQLKRIQSQFDRINATGAHGPGGAAARPR